jgi:hypothetical protein
MKTVKTIIAGLALFVICGNVDAQFGGINRAAQRGVQRGVERSVEKKSEEIAEKEVNKGIDKAYEAQTKGEEEAVKGLEKLDKAMTDTTQTAPVEATSRKKRPSTGMTAENAFFPIKEGVTQVFAQKDGKGKIKSQSRTTVSKVSGTPEKLLVTYQMEMLDAKGKSAKEPQIFNYNIEIEDGVLYVDMKNLFGAMNGLEDGSIEVSGNAMGIPADIKAGETLDDSDVQIKIGYIKLSAVITDAKCEAIEDVTVGAGTFQAYKISQTTTATVMGIKSTGKTLSWYVKGVGAVKTESINAKGEVISVEELLKIDN